MGGKMKRRRRTHIINSSIKAHHIIRQLLQLAQKARGNDNNVARVGSDDAEEAMFELYVFANVSILFSPFPPALFPFPSFLFVARFIPSIANTSDLMVRHTLVYPST